MNNPPTNISTADVLSDLPDRILHHSHKSYAGSGTPVAPLQLHKYSTDCLTVSFRVRSTVLQTTENTGHRSSPIENVWPLLSTSSNLERAILQLR